MDLAFDVIDALRETPEGQELLALVRRQIVEKTAVRDSNGSMENLLIAVAEKGYRYGVVNLIDQALGTPDYES